jgi:hypothetical protein
LSPKSRSGDSLYRVYQLASRAITPADVLSLKRDVDEVMYTTTFAFL